MPSGGSFSRSWVAANDNDNHCQSKAIKQTNLQFKEHALESGQYFGEEHWPNELDGAYVIARVYLLAYNDHGLG